MATLIPDGYLQFTFNAAQASAGTMTATSPFSYTANTNPELLVDVDDDLQPDGADPSPSSFDAFAGNVYSGFTIEINGLDYAIFGTIGTAWVPFFNSVEDLSGLDGTGVSQPITDRGDNATVSNMCFMAGTMIGTPTRETPVESLHIGDLVETADGRAVPVRWIGRQTVQRDAGLGLAARSLPVLIRKGALGNHADLYVSADHGMVVDGYVINASALVNGETILFAPRADVPESFVYYHVETEHHDIILANGAATETFVDAVTRSRFDNHAEYLAIYGAERLIPEMHAPRIASARLVPADIAERLLGDAPAVAQQKAG